MNSRQRPDALFPAVEMNIGETGADLLVGGAAKDILIGGTGKDILEGGTGADRFRLNALKERDDRICNFSMSDGDLLQLLKQSFSSNLTKGIPKSNQSSLRLSPG